MKPFSVVVFSCGDLGAEVAERLLDVPGVGAVSLFTAPYSRKKLSFSAKLKQVYRQQGPWGLARVAAGKLLSLGRIPEGGDRFGVVPDRVNHRHFFDLHSPECLQALRELSPDLGVVAGTYILKESVFAAPRLGSINLHTGRVPQYRGAAPAFWELYNGEQSVGITIHRVLLAVDAGAILAAEEFPLNPAPTEDPLRYIERYRRETLRPNGIRLLAQVVAQIAAGSAQERPQPTEGARTYRSPDYQAIRELRRRVQARRRAKAAGGDA